MEKTHQVITEDLNPYGPLLPAAINKIMRESSDFFALSSDEQMATLVAKTQASRSVIEKALKDIPITSQGADHFQNPANSTADPMSLGIS